jgi:hypothetical protein
MTQAMGHIGLTVNVIGIDEAFHCGQEAISRTALSNATKQRIEKYLHFGTNHEK